MMEISVKTIERFEAKFTPEPNSGCWLWIGAKRNNYGYGSFVLGRDENAHRAAWIIYRGPIPEGKWVLHKCDVAQCVNPDHLFLGTCLENHADMNKKGRRANFAGNKHPNAKFSDEQIISIRADPRKYAEISHDYGVIEGTISRIKNRKRWAHIQ